MADDVATADQLLTADEVQKAMLHMAAAIHNLHASVEEIIPYVQEFTRTPGRARPGEKWLHSSRLQLAEALKILVKDPSDG